MMSDNERPTELISIKDYFVLDPKSGILTRETHSAECIGIYKTRADAILEVKRIRCIEKGTNAK